MSLFKKKEQPFTIPQCLECEEESDGIYALATPLGHMHYCLDHFLALNRIRLMNWHTTKDELPADGTIQLILAKPKDSSSESVYILNFGTYRLKDHSFYISINEPIEKYSENEVLYWTYLSEIPVPDKE